MIDSIESQLRRDEGERLNAYLDSIGYLTIGVGRLIDAKKGGGITREESAYLLANDIKRKSASLDERLPWWRDLSPTRQGVLLNMAFQLGIDGLCAFTTTLWHIREGRFLEAAVAMLDSKWAKQTPGRAQRLADQIVADDWR